MQLNTNKQSTETPEMSGNISILDHFEPSRTVAFKAQESQDNILKMHIQRVTQ